MAYEIIPMSSGYNPQYTANKQGLGHWPPGFFKRCLSAKKTCAQTHIPWMPMFLSTWFQTNILNDTRKNRNTSLLTLCNSQKVMEIWASTSHLYFPLCLRQTVYKFGDPSFHLLSLTTTPNSHEMQWICPLCAYQTGVSCLWYLEIHHVHSTLQVALLQKTTAHNRYIEKMITK